MTPKLKNNLSFVFVGFLALILIGCAVKTVVVTETVVIHDTGIPAGVNNQIKNLITGDESTARAAAQALKDYPFDSLSHWIRNFAGFTLPDTIGVPYRLEHHISDSLTAPYFVYIPEGYDPQHPTPLLIWLHGGVSRQQFIEDRSKEISDHTIFSVCKENGWLLLFPLARFDCLWWNDEGMDHLSWLVRETKRSFNIDDDRVALAGFSDGGSGAYHMALLRPTDYSVFFPWSGHIAVGSLVGGMRVYLPNLRNRPLYATNGGADRLYPADKMKKYIDKAIEIGADLNFTAFDSAGHNYGYLEDVIPLVAPRMEANVRRALQPQLYWETSHDQFGVIDWLEITEVDTSGESADWHDDINFREVDDRITIGFNIDNEWEGEGVKVGSVMPDTSLPAANMGLKVGDIVVGQDEFSVKTIQDLVAAKAAKKRGDSFTLTVLRDGMQVELKGGFPPPREYDIFARGVPSGAVDVRKEGNTFNVNSSRIKAFSVKLHPEMINLDQPVVVKVNGQIMFEDKVTADVEYMLQEFVKNRDRKLLWMGQIDLEVN